MTVGYLFKYMSGHCAMCHCGAVFNLVLFATDLTACSFYTDCLLFEVL